MKTVGLLAAAVLVLTAQAPAPPAQPHIVHLVYRFGYNTEATNSGQGTGTTTIDIKGAAADGGLIVSAADFWWNTVRSRATNTCEVYKDGSVDCKAAPYAISPMQLTILPLLAKNFFSHISADGHSKWTQNFTVKAAVVPGATGFAGQKYTWTCAWDLQGKGPVPDSPPLLLIQTTGTLSQGYFKAASKSRIAFDPVRHVPAVVSERRTHIPQRSSESFDVINLKLQKIQNS